MKSIQFKKDILPHLMAVVVFLLVTIFFFNPVFFDNKVINQNDINQFLWGSKDLRDYRAATGEEGLWSRSMFSGMPAYMVNLDWSDGAVAGLKKIFSLFLPHPVSNIFLSFVCYYIMLLTFRVRPYLAIAGALAFGLTSYMIIGLSAGHNSRIGAIALMPLVMAGIHLAFTGKRILGLGVTAAALALHLREGHAQITYYLIMIVGVYGIVQFISFLREKQLPDYFKSLGMLTVAAVIAAATYFGPLWAITELSAYSTRGKSELVSTKQDTQGSGLPKSYAFQYSNGIFEPITLLIPNFYGGSSSNALVRDQQSETYQALVQSSDQNMANQLVQYTSSYWGEQPLSAPYYAGAIIVFLFVLGLLVAEKKYVWWHVPVCILALMMSWGSNFESFNYFIFDYLPGYNKFRSVTFVMVMVFFALPLLGALALENYLASGATKEMKRKLIIAFSATGGLCLFFILFAGIFDFSRSVEDQLPAWFLNALRTDRESLMRSDAIRSFSFITGIFILLFFNVPKKIAPAGFFAFLAFMVMIDLAVVDYRYFTKDNYQRKREFGSLSPWASDEAILKDKSNHRVAMLQDFYQAGTSYFHQSIGGYHGVRLKRYQELIDSCIFPEQERLIRDAQNRQLELSGFGVHNMLNAKYFLYGDKATDFITNPYANGNAWFVKEVVSVNSANEELQQTKVINTREQAVIDQSKFKPEPFIYDSLSRITLQEVKLSYLKYESESATDGLAVFSEIYYPKGWSATIDGKPAAILRANYVLRAMNIPAGKHIIEFRFEPKPYTVGNTITMASSWLVLLVLLGSIGWSLKKD